MSPPVCWPGGDDVWRGNGAKEGCPYAHGNEDGHVRANSMRLYVGTQQVQLYQQSNSNFYDAYTDNAASRMLTFVVDSWGGDGYLRVRFDQGPYHYYTLPNQATIYFIPDQSSNSVVLIEFDIVQAPCAGDVIEEYSISVHQAQTP